MKITKSQLREMIREEIQKLDEGKLPKHYGIYHDSSNSYILAYSRYNWEPSSSEIAKIEKTLMSLFKKLDIPDKKLDSKPGVFVMDGYVACGLTFTTKSDIEDAGYDLLQY